MAMNIFEFIKSRISIVDVVQEYVTLKRAGLYHKGRCPFHDEKTASFTVSPHREIFYCFGCHKGGDAVTFISEIERCTPIEAARHLAERYSIDVPETIPTKIFTEVASKNIQRHSAICSLFAQWCHERLTKSDRAGEYFKKRDIVEASVRNFMLGYFPEQALGELLAYMKSHGFLARDLIDSSLIAEGKFGLYSPFAERLIFPINDHLGRVCGFGGRIFREDDQRPKYYNSQEHDFFSKGRILFGLDRAKKAMQTKQTVFLVEGYLDCIAMVQAGYTNTVASLGTACTSDQCKILARYVRSLNLVYDGDAAGREAMVRMAHVLWSANIEPYVIALPAQEDPASFLQKNKNLDALISRAQDVFLFYMNYVGADYHNKTLQERLDLIQELLATIAMLNDRLMQNFLLQKAAATFNISLQTLVESSEKLGARREKSATVGVPNVSSEMSGDYVRSTPLEDLVFASLIGSKKALSAEDEELVATACSGPTGLLIEKFLIYNKSIPDHRQDFNFGAFLESLDIEEKRLAAHIIIEHGEVPEDFKERALKLLWKREWKRKVCDITARLKQAESSKNHEFFARISQEFDTLKKKMKEKGIL